MSYAIEEHKDGGYAYRIEINGLTTKGWRAGARADVEKHVSDADQYGTYRAAGSVPKKNADGSFRMNMNGKVKKVKPETKVGEE